MCVTKDNPAIHSEIRPEKASYRQILLGVRQINRFCRIPLTRSRLTSTVDENWSKIIFSDDMAETVFDCRVVNVWRQKGSFKTSPGRDLKVMVLGCITYHG